MKNKAMLLEENGCRVRVVHLDRVNRARIDAIPESELERLALTFKVLGDPTRLKIFVALSGGEMCVCDLAAYLGLSESAVSHQLRILRNLKIVRYRREGKVVYYRLDDHHVSTLINQTLEHVKE